MSDMLDYFCKEKPESSTSVDPHLLICTSPCPYINKENACEKVGGIRQVLLQNKL